MDSPNAPAPSNCLAERKEPPAPPLCPVCGAFLLLMRGFGRCPRCQYRICEECDGGAEEA
jgi:hypothetical protein